MKHKPILTVLRKNMDGKKYKAGGTMDNTRNETFNAAGYKDMTAYIAVQNVTQAEEEEKRRLTRLMYCVKTIMELSDFKLEERIVVTDKRTGKTYR